MKFNYAVTKSWRAMWTIMLLKINVLCCDPSTDNDLLSLDDKNDRATFLAEIGFIFGSVWSTDYRIRTSSTSVVPLYTEWSNDQAVQITISLRSVILLLSVVEILWSCVSMTESTFRTVHWSSFAIQPGSVLQRKFCSAGAANTTAISIIADGSPRMTANVIS